MSKTKLVLAALGVLLLRKGLASAQGRFAPDDQIFAQVAETASRIRKVLDQIDLTKLPLQYTEGKVVEGQRELSIQWSVRLTERMAALKRTHSLSAHLDCLLAVREFDATVDSLSCSLNNPITYSQTKAMETSSDWARKLVDGRRALSQSWLKCLSAVREAVVRADDLLARCGGGNPD